MTKKIEVELGLAYLYLLKSADLYKVGKSENIDARLDQYKNGYPHAAFIKTWRVPVDTLKEAEDAMIAAVSACTPRLSGRREWFTEQPDIEVIKSAIAIYTNAANTLIQNRVTDQTKYSRLRTSVPKNEVYWHAIAGFRHFREYIENCYGDFNKLRWYTFSFISSATHFIGAFEILTRHARASDFSSRQEYNGLRKTEKTGRRAIEIWNNAALDLHTDWVACVQFGPHTEAIIRKLSEDLVTALLDLPSAEVLFELSRIFGDIFYDVLYEEDEKPELSAESYLKALHHLTPKDTKALTPYACVQDAREMEYRYCIRPKTKEHLQLLVWFYAGVHLRSDIQKAASSLCICGSGKTTRECCLWRYRNQLAYKASVTWTLTEHGWFRSWSRGDLAATDEVIGDGVADIMVTQTMTMKGTISSSSKVKKIKNKRRYKALIEEHGPCPKRVEKEEDDESFVDNNPGNRRIWEDMVRRKRGGSAVDWNSIVDRS